MSDTPAALPRVVVYSTGWCSQCRRAMDLLTRRGIAYQAVDAEQLWGDAFRDELFKLAGQMTVPQIVIDGRAIGGHSDLMALDESGELARMMRPADSPAT